MKKRMIALMLASAAIVGAAATAYGSAAPGAEAAALVVPAAADPFEERVEYWIARLAKEEGFSAWEGAAWRKYALGPGQHGWVVILHGQGGEELGYLVVAAEQGSDGYILVEYGVGSYPLFSTSTLERALRSEQLTEEGTFFTAQASIERWYVGGAQALWKVSENGVTRFADAKTGIWLPIDERDAAKETPLAPSDSSAGLKLAANVAAPRHILLSPADPYASIAWLDAAATNVRDWQEFLQWLDAGEGMFASRAFSGAALTPMGVAGYHWWPAAAHNADESADAMRGFVAVEQEGLRYIPLERLLSDGSFH